MFFKTGIVLILTLTTMIFSYTEIVNFLPVTLQGKVVDAQSGKPVATGHVYIVQGEEEVFTSSNGEFSLKTWEKYPVTVTVEHKGYKKQSVQFNAETKQLIISLIAVK